MSGGGVRLRERFQHLVDTHYDSLWCYAHFLTGGAWRWVKSAEAVRLDAGKRTITIKSSKHGSSLDCFYLSTDAAFNPAGHITAAEPARLTLSAVSVEGYPRLSWAGPKDGRFSHYNLYCDSRANLTPGRTTLIASPDAPERVNWQIQPGINWYKVTQVTLDGLESEPSNEVSVQKSPLHLHPRTTGFSGPRGNRRVSRTSNHAGRGCIHHRLEAGEI